MLPGMTSVAARMSESQSLNANPALRDTGPRVDSSQQTKAVLQQAAQTRQQTDELTLTASANDIPNDNVRVSTTIGKSASSGALSKEDALAIYQKIATML